MNKEYTPEQRRDLAQKLRGIYQLLQSIDPENMGITEEQQEDILFDLDDAIFALSPAFAAQEASDLDTALNSPEMDAFMEEMKKDPGYQQGLEEFKNLTQKVVSFPGKKKEDKDG